MNELKSSDLFESSCSQEVTGAVDVGLFLACKRDAHVPMQNAVPKRKTRLSSMVEEGKMVIGRAYR